jgi:ABC-type antimicrobial peptide transport system permease subunit
MLLPLGYAVRNLRRRGLRTAVTLVGVALVSFLVVLTTGFATGLDRSVASSARDDVVYVVGASGETDLVRSFLSYASAREIADTAPGVIEERRGSATRRAASIEAHVASRVGDRIGLLRGVTDAAWLVHPAVVVVQGVEPRGPYELLAGRLAEARMGLPDHALDVGRTVRLENRDWKVVGRFAAPGTVFEAEIWGRLEDVMAAAKRVDVSAVVLRLSDPSRFGDVHRAVTSNVRLEATAKRSSALFGSLQSALAPLAALAWLMAGLVLVGGLFACANTMFAAVLARTREMGTLRAVGYGPVAVGVALLEESLLVGLAGGAIGFAFASLAGEVSLKYPSGAFTLDLSSVRFLGLAAAAAAGLLGGLVPAWRAVRLPLPDALAGRL